VVVVGGTSGIGLAVATECARRGDDVLVVARDAARVQAVADDLATGTGQVLGHAADVADAEGVEEAMRAAATAFGRIDAIVTTAQPMVYGTVEQVPDEALRRMVDVAVGGTAHLAHAALPRFRAQGGGHLVVVGSLLSQISVPSMGAYCSAKAGQHALVRALQQEVRGDRGIHVSLVLPGAIDTPIYHQAATYAGSRGSAPPPVARVSRAAQVTLDCLDRPRRIAHVGVGNRIAMLGFRYLPSVYERLAPVLVRHVVLRGPRSEPDPGNLHRPSPRGEGLSGGWTTAGRLRHHGSARWRRKS
jgi:short-subunit dehydrogenase